MKKITIILILSSCAIITVLLAGYIQSRKPSALYIQISDAPWSQVAIVSDNLPGKKIFQPTQPLNLSPISHGVYVVSVKYETGETIWTTFFNYDVGARKRIDLFFSGDPKSGSISVQEIANGNTTLYNGQIIINETSEKKPLALDWI